MSKFFNCVLFIAFNAYVSLPHTENLSRIFYSVYYFLPLFKHESVVAGDVGLAFRSVYDERIHPLFRHQLDVSGKSCAAHTDNTCLFDPFE